MTKNKQSLLLGVATALLVAMAPGRSQAVCTGDPTGSGISGADVSAVLVCINNPSNPACAGLCGGAGLLDCADVNVDGIVNIFDAVAIANEAAGAPCPLNIVPLCVSRGPQLACGSTISSDITSNVVLGACNYFLDGTIFVDPGVVVTITAGARLQGRIVSSDGTPSALIFLQGDCAALANDNKPGAGEQFSARINAVGNANNPIVFTSDAPAGSKATGQWAGIAFNGCSIVNFPGGVGEAEGLTDVEFGGGGCIGGGNDGLTCNGPGDCPGGTCPVIFDESTGVARYVRAEFAGRELAPNNELNVWTMNALGSCTDFSFIQAHMGADDGFEWFGGTVGMKNIVATANRDDNLDWQIGSRQKVQYAVVQQTAANLDTAGSNGFEGDNNEFGLTNLPYSDPRICNATLIGEPNPPGGTNVGALLRRGTAGRFAKTIVTGFDDGGLQLRETETAVHACSAPPGPFSLAFQTAPQLLWEASVFGLNDNGGQTGANDCALDHSSTGSECNSTDFCGLITSTAAFPAGLDNTTRACSINAALTVPIAYGQLNPVPAVASEASNTFDCNTGFGGDSFFDNTAYLGAIDPAGPTWLTAPWINFSTN